MKKYTLCFLLAGTLAFAQQHFTIEETVLGGRKYAPTTLVGQQWRKNTASISYLSADYSQLLEKSAANGWKETTLATQTAFEKALKNKITNDSFALRMFPYEIEWKSAQTFETEVAGNQNNYKVIYDVESQQITQVVAYPKEGAQAKFAHNGYVAWLKDNNIRITTPEKIIEVTQDENPSIVNGSDYVHRQEFGIDRGMWWNEAGTQLAYYRKDETMVKNYPLTNWNEREATNKDIKYPMAGMKSEEVTLVVFDVARQQKVTLQTGEPKEQYLTMVTWDPSGKFIYVEIGRAHV